jgi:hypothetical protein
MRRACRAGGSCLGLREGGFANGLHRFKFGSRLFNGALDAVGREGAALQSFEGTRKAWACASTAGAAVCSRDASRRDLRDLH